MRSITRSATITLAGLTLAVPLAGQGAATAPMPPEGTPLVFVNTQAILPIAPGADSAQAAFEVVLQGFEEELQSLATEIDSMLAAYRQQEAILDQAGKEAKQQEILDKQRAAQSRQAELEVESNRRRADLLNPILERVRAVVEELRAERQYAIVFDIAESGVVAADSSLDITAAVLERLGVDPSALASGPGR